MKYISSAFIVMLLFTHNVSGQLKIPSLSPRVQSTFEIGLSEVSFSYSQPSKRGRKIFGDGGIIPDGSSWRTGANAATKISFSQDVTLSGHNLPSGEYTIISEIEKKKWTIKFYNYHSSNWNTYLAEVPVVTISQQFLKTQDVAESLTMGLSHAVLDEAKFFILWDKIKLELDLKVNIHEKIMQDIERVVQGTSSNEYFQAATYLHEQNVDLERALVYVRKVTSQESARFFHLYREAAILKDLGREIEMKAAARRALESAQKAGNEDFVRLNQLLLK